jgi:signal transduction histidine kinase
MEKEQVVVETYLPDICDVEAQTIKIDKKSFIQKILNIVNNYIKYN